MSGPQPSHESAASAISPDDSRRTLGICLFLAAITFMVFGQTLHYAFVNYDDNDYAYQNRLVAGGLNPRGIAWVFTHAECSLYHPLTMLSLMADCQFHQFQAGWFHLTSLLLHTASVIVLFLTLRRMTGEVWRSAFVAAFFAIHPLRVESVAWIAERKDVLAGFCFMLTLAAYARYVQQPKSLARYLTVAAAFVCALLSKPTVVTLPFVLLLLDYWPLNRFEQSTSAGQSRFLGIPQRLILEKIPLLVLSALGCALTVWAARHEIDTARTPFLMRLGSALVSYAVYLRQMVWPEALAVFYPQPKEGYPFGIVAMAFVVLTAISAGVLIFQRKRRWLLTGWLWFLGMLIPMIGVVHLGAFSHADRFTYLSQIGLYIAVTWLVAELPVNRAALGGIGVCMVGALIFLAREQTVYWRNSETLWRHALDCTARNYVAHLNLGIFLQDRGKADDAIEQYHEVLQIKPRYADAHYDLGNALESKGKMDDAIFEYRQAVEINPHYAKAYNNLGSAFYRSGKLDEGLALLERAAQLDPLLVEAQNNLGNALLGNGRIDEAIAAYKRALKLDPRDAQARQNLDRAVLLKQ